MSGADFPRLTVIEASAGTGKTFSLVTRLLRLIFSGAEPERIVALTFSRMAAGEIFNSFIERLARAAADKATAAAESARVAVPGATLGRGDFAAMLRKVISRQHLSLIGTLDSFLMKIVRMIPLELGLEGELTVMSDFRSPIERLRLVGEMMGLASDDAKAVFREAFALALDGIGSKSFLEGFSGFIAGWHTLYRDHAEPRLWGEPETIWGGNPPADLDVTLGTIRACADRLAGHAGERGADTFIEAVRGFGGTLPKLPACLRKEPLAAEAMRLMTAWQIARALKETRGILRLMHAYEAVYAAKVRARGLITFDDVPRLLKTLEAGVRLPLEYRMDARFDHWALDEFQDTSGGQWDALRNLIDESRQAGPGRSVFIVGDRKQAIYDWRGGDVRFLGEQVKEAAGEGNRLAALVESRRYLPAISAAVNRVFDEATIRGAFDMDHAPEEATWRCPAHRSHDTDAVGFVQVVQATKAKRRASISDFFEPVASALNAVRPWERGISTAILVRKNDYGEALLAHLKSIGIDKVVFEGDSRVMDSPVLATFVALVRLAEHAGDAFAYARILHSPIARALWPDGAPEPAELSARLLADFTRLGMVRKFREVREALKSVPDTWNDFTESRFEDLVKCAAEFEELRDETVRLSDFAGYLDAHTRRDYAEPGMVRILTMHQSKGLGFDHVIIPFYEDDDLFASRHRRHLSGEGGGWLLADPGSAASASDDTLRAADERNRARNLYASLCLDYVAMTRAKKALTIILHPLNAKPNPTPRTFSDLVRLVGLETSGDAQWHLKAKPEKGGGKATADLPAIVRGRRAAIGKVRPSETFYQGLTGDRLFADGFGAAAERGTALHAEFEQVEWIAPEAAADELARALVRPDGCTGLWRERAFEIFREGEWTSGCFDRVVFIGEGAERRAIIYDFKTNAKGKGEGDADFALRLAETYAGQMAAYRKALATLTGLPAARISSVLLLTATRAAVRVGAPTNHGISSSGQGKGDR